MARKKNETHVGVDWGIGEATTIHFSIDPTTGEKVVFSQEQIDDLDRLRIEREYVALERHRRATMMIDYRLATCSPNQRQHWRKMQRNNAIRIYQR